ncbi:Amidohydrolase [Bradyrhizobium sp. STM 3843]|uniref:amidohydrolase family protein n=1 Tax=Bradyrhizobium sp. STM 3843 TaxID=551947 RepID=UPI00024035AD|nr:amidohydrolase family protein [Bradyrhizobium sp. STM 3843]CCE10766.1 Amidohydrolase [Bradyrhizobium sp. STM 3843]
MDRRSFVEALLAGTAISVFGGPRYSLGAEFVLNARNAPKGGKVLIKGGSLITMDPAVPDLAGDVLIENGKIAAIGRQVEAAGAEIVDASRLIVAPGFIETHRHTWQSCLRHLGANWSAAQYFANNFFKFGVVMRPEDVYAANLIGRLAALDDGITTLVDWSHIMNSPAHADAAVQGLRDALARSVFAMGWPQAPDPAKWISKSTQDSPDDIRRVRKQHFSSNDGLVTLAMAGRGPDFAVIQQVGRDLSIARDLAIPTTIHVGFAVPGGIKAMKEAGLLGSDITHVHVKDSTDEELQFIRDTGGTVSISPLDEMLRVRWRRGLPPVIRIVEKGLVTSLSCDSESTSSGDMFSIMKTTLAVGRYQASNPSDDRPEPPNWNAARGISTRKAFEMATIEGARTAGLEKVTGSLTVGKSADIILLQADNLAYYPLQNPVDAIVGAADAGCIEAVFVAGTPVKFGGKLLDDALVARARRLAAESREYLFQKVGFARG